MLTIPVEIRKSDIHGSGVFAVNDIRKGAVIWKLSPTIDHVYSDYAVKYGEPEEAAFIRARGFINPDKPSVWILPGDDAQYMNFPRCGEAANTVLGGMIDGQHLLLAAVDIPAGTEITVPPESDADYERKTGTH